MDTNTQSGHASALSASHGSAEWEACAHQLAAALQGAAKRHQITLAELLCEDAPTFDPPAPTRLDNIKAIGAALATYRSLLPNDQVQKCGARCSAS